MDSVDAAGADETAGRDEAEEEEEEEAAEGAEDIAGRRGEAAASVRGI